MKTETPALIAKALQEMQLQLVESPLQGRPRFLGKSADGHTQLELMGPMGQLRGFTIVADVSPDHLEAARRNGALMSLFLELAAPLWRARTQWLLAGMAQFSRLRPLLERYPRASVPKLKSELGYANVELAFLHKTNQVVLKVQMRGRYATLAA